MEQETNYMLNKVFVQKDCRGDSTNPLQKKKEKKKYDNGAKPAAVRSERKNH